MFEREKGRAVADDETCRRLEAHIVRNAVNLVGGRDIFLRKSTALPRRCHHAIAHGAYGHTFADLENCSGEFVSRNVRQLRLELIFSGNDQRVGKVYRTGFHPDANLTGLRAGALPPLRPRALRDRPIDGNEPLSCFMHLSAYGAVPAQRRQSSRDAFGEAGRVPITLSRASSAI